MTQEILDRLTTLWDSMQYHLFPSIQVQFLNQVGSFCISLLLQLTNTIAACVQGVLLYYCEHLEHLAKEAKLSDLRLWISTQTHSG